MAVAGMVLAIPLPAADPVMFLPSQGIAAAGDARHGMTLVVGPDEPELLSGSGLAVVWPGDPGAIEAVAAACAGWWAPDRPDRDDGARRLTRKSTVPALSRRLHMTPSPPVVDRVQVQALMLPWCETADDLQTANGRWYSRMDAIGREVLGHVLDVYLIPQSMVPPWMAPPRWAHTDAMSLGSVTPTWQAWAETLARRSGHSVGIAPEVAIRPAPSALAGDPQVKLGWSGPRDSGAWVLALQLPESRLHPALRRVVTCLPVGHLIRWGDAAFLADRLRRLDPARWAQPGWMIAAGPGGNLLVAADVPTIHQVVHELAAWDAALALPTLP
jgi:hypothetical protein